jgi:polysaccharide pyruvyl transferase WcaK-like protein
MKNITILGWYGHGNIGDESYKESFKLLLPNDNLTFTDKIEDCHKNSDLFILGGGAVMEPPFINQLDTNKNNLVISVTATKNTPIESLSRFKKIIVRDVLSEAYLKQNNIPCDLMPDTAFLLNTNSNKGREYLSSRFEEENHDLYNKVIVIVYNAHLGVVESQLAKDQFTFLKTATDLAEIIDSTNASFVFVPFGQSAPWDDRITNSWLASRCKFWKKNLVIYDRINFQEMINIIACADVVISSRLHASIFSCVAGVPFIDISHHDKNLGFLKTINREMWSVPYWRFDYNKCTLLLKEFLENRMTHCDELKNLVIQQKNKISEVISHVHCLSQ